MRRVCGFDTLSAHLVRKSLSLSLSVALGVLPMATAFGREDERTSYLANNRYQDYQNQYKPEKNYSASSQLDRQIRMQNTALALRFQAPTATSLGRVDVPKPTYQSPTIKFDFLGNNAPKVPNALRATPEALTAPMKPGLLNTIGNALKTVGHAMAYPFQRIGQGIVGLIQRAFGSGNRTTTLTESQRATLKAYNNIQPTGDGTFKATGQTVAFGRTLEEGATFKVEGDQLRLIQGTSFERTFGGIERKDGGLMPLKMAEVNGHIQPTGLDFDRLAPNTALRIKSPVTVEGFGDLKAGEMIYQGAWKSPEGQTTGGRFKFENTLLDLNKDLAQGMDMNNPVALRQATFALQAGLMRLNSAVVEKGSRKYFVSQDQSPMEIGRLEKTAGDLTKASEANFGKIESIKRDLTHRSEAAGHFYKVLSEATGQGGSISFEFKERFNDLEKEAGAIRAGSRGINESVNAGDYAGLDTATAEVSRRQEALTQTTGTMAKQAEALRGLQRGFRGMAEEAKGVFLKADGEKLKTEGPLADEELARRATDYFPKEKARVNVAAGKTLDAVKSLVDEGVLTPEQGTQMGAQIMALRDRVLGAVPPQTATGAAREAVATAFNRPYEVGKNLVDRGADAAFFGWMGKVAETHPTLGQAVGTVGGAVAQGADTVNKVVGTAGLAYFAVTATITTAAALGTAVVAQKVLEQVGVSEEAAGAWSMVASLYVGAKVGNNETVKSKERAITRGIISKVEGFAGQVREWFGGGRQRTYDIGERTPEGRLAGEGPGTPPKDYEKKLTGPRRTGLPVRTPEESLLKGQLTDAQWELMRQKAMEFNKDIYLCGSYSETDLGFARRYSLTGMSNQQKIAIGREMGMPDWRALKYESGLIDTGFGDVDIWEGARLTEGEKQSILKDIFPHVKGMDNGYSLKHYPSAENLGGKFGPGALVFKADGTVARISAGWQ